MPLLRSRAGRTEPVALTVQVDRPGHAPVWAEPVLKLQAQPRPPRTRASVSFPAHVVSDGGGGGAVRSARRVTRKSPYAKPTQHQPMPPPDPPNPYALADSMADMLLGPVSARTRLRRRQFALLDPAAPPQSRRPSIRDPTAAPSAGAMLARASVTLTRLPAPPSLSIVGSHSGSSVPLHKARPIRSAHRKLAPISSKSPVAVDATRPCRPPREAMAEERKRRAVVAAAAAAASLGPFSESRQPPARQSSLASYTAASGRHVAVSVAH